MPAVYKEYIKGVGTRYVCILNDYNDYIDYFDECGK